MTGHWGRLCPCCYRYTVCIFLDERCSGFGSQDKWPGYIVFEKRKKKEKEISLDSDWVKPKFSQMK